MAAYPSLTYTCYMATKCSAKPCGEGTHIEYSILRLEKQIYAEHSFLLQIIFILVSKQQVSNNNTYTQERTSESLETYWQH